MSNDIGKLFFFLGNINRKKQIDTKTIISVQFNERNEMTMSAKAQAALPVVARSIHDHT